MEDTSRMGWTHSCLMAKQEMWAKGIENDAGRAKEAQKDLEELRAEFRRGVSMDAKIFCIVGRKPSPSE